MSLDQTYPLLLFDGVCNLCNAWVDFVFRIDRNSLVKLAALQGEFSRKTVPANLREPLNSLLYTRDGLNYFSESTAVLELLKDLGRPWSLFYLLRYVPKFIRDGIYRKIAKNRYRLFGQRLSCRLPTAEEAKRFLE